MLPPDLTPGPALDARVGDAMGAEPKWAICDTADGWVSTTVWSTPDDAEESRQMWAHPERCRVIPVYPAYSAPTGGAWEACQRWITAQHLTMALYFLGEQVECEVFVGSEKEDPIIRVFGDTAALAVCAAVLAVSGRGHDEPR